MGTQCPKFEEKWFFQLGALRRHGFHGVRPTVARPLTRVSSQKYAPEAPMLAESSET